MSLAAKILPFRAGYTLTFMPWVMGGLLCVLLVLGLGVCGIRFAQHEQGLPVLTIELPSFVAEKPTLMKTIQAQLAQNRSIVEKTVWVPRKELASLEERLGVTD